MRYPLEQLYQECSFLGYYFHWDYKTLLSLEHHERRKWCAEVSRINKELSKTSNERPLE